MTTDPRRAEAEKIASEIIEACGRPRPAYPENAKHLGEAIAEALLAAEERGAKAERAAWTECTRDLGPVLAKAKADGVLDTLIEANIWPLPATCITDADIRRATEVAIAIRPVIEAEQCARGQWQPIDTAPKDGSWFVICRADEGEDSYEVGSYAPHLHPRYSWVEGDMYRKTLEPVYDWRGFNNFHRATHWMPLPPLPSPQEGE